MSGTRSDDRIKVSGFKRAQSAKANGAATRYQNNLNKKRIGPEINGTFPSCFRFIIDVWRYSFEKMDRI